MLVWGSFCAALMPISLRAIPERLAAYLAQLARSTNAKPRQATAFLGNLGEEVADARGG